MKLLITGATGFVGRNLTQRLLDLGHDVRIIARSTKSISLHNKNLEVVLGDVTDISSLKLACRGVDTVFHLAGVVGYTKAMLSDMQAVNVSGTQNIVDAFLQAGGRRFVHMSSVVAIGASFDRNHVLDESSPFNLHHMNLGYFETKLAAEKIVLKAVADGLNAVILNPSTIYGAGDATKGSRSTQIKVAQGRFPFYSSGGVSVVHIDDVIQGVLAAWQKGRLGERYILSGENVTIKELFDMIAHEAKVKAPHIYLPQAVIKSLGMVGAILEHFNLRGPLNSENASASTLYHWYSHQKATDELGFQPCPAVDAIRDSVQWMKANKII